MRYLRFSIKSILLLMVLSCGLAFYFKPSILRFYAKWNDDGQPERIFTEDEMKEVIGEWERIWFNDEPIDPSFRTHGGVI